MGKAFVPELFCYHKEELEICDYCVTIYADGSSLTQGTHRINETTAYASLTIYDSGERYSGGGYCDDGIYAEICAMLQQAVPAEAWEEMEKRESAYYQR